MWDYVLRYREALREVYGRGSTSAARTESFGPRPQEN